MNATSRRVFIAGAGKRDSIGTGHGRTDVAALVRSVEAPARGIRIVEVPENRKGGLLTRLLGRLWLGSLGFQFDGHLG